MHKKSSMKPIFFYGLFMDESLLKEKGFHPSRPVLAYVNDFGLRIGERATLIKSEGERAYGSIMSLNEAELETLYGETSVADYVPEKLVAISTNSDSINVLVYNLPMKKLKGRNIEYARSLVNVAKKVGLPSDYIIGIEQWTK